LPPTDKWGDKTPARSSCIWPMEAAPMNAISSVLRPRQAGLGGPLPTPWVLSLPMWCYKLAMLAWALWLAGALVGWGRWAFAAWINNGYWPAKQTPPAQA